MQQSGQVLSVLVSLKDTAEGFTQELQQNLAGVDVAELRQIAAAVFHPFESQISRSGTGRYPCLALLCRFFSIHLLGQLVVFTELFLCMSVAAAECLRWCGTCFVAGNRKLDPLLVLLSFAPFHSHRIMPQVWGAAAAPGQHTLGSNPDP